MIPAFTCEAFMLLPSSYLWAFIVLTFSLVGCTEPKVSTEPTTYLMGAPIRVKSADLAVTLISIAQMGSEGTLIEDAGWREYVIEIENISTNVFTVENVKLLNQDGRYVDSASTYEQITAPPNAGVAVAGNVAGTVVGAAAGQIIPYGGMIYSVLSSAASASSAEAKSSAKRVFMLRALKDVELAPTGKVEGSAFLPHIMRPKTLVVVYTQNGETTNRIEIPLPTQGL